MKLYLFSVALFSLVSLLLAANTENYEVAQKAAGSTTLQRGQRYAFYEYWTTSRLTFAFPDCITGYKHIRLVVGEVKMQPNKKDMNFRGTAWDLIVDEEDAKKKLQGGSNLYTSEGWDANVNSKGKKVSNAYVYAGTVSKSDSGVKQAGKWTPMISLLIFC